MTTRRIVVPVCKCSVFAIFLQNVSEVFLSKYCKAAILMVMKIADFV